MAFLVLLILLWLYGSTWLTEQLLDAALVVTFLISGPFTYASKLSLSPGWSHKGSKLQPRWNPTWRIGKLGTQIPSSCSSFWWETTSTGTACQTTVLNWHGKIFMKSSPQTTHGSSFWEIMILEMQILLACALSSIHAWHALALVVDAVAQLHFPINLRHMLAISSTSTRAVLVATPEQTSTSQT